MIDSRRSFFIKSAKIGLGASIFSTIPLSAISSMRKYVSPNEKVNFGLIGCKGMGWADMKSILKNSETDCIAICDVDENVLNNRSNNVEEVTGKKPLLYGDYRKMLENKDTDPINQEDIIPEIVEQ